MMNINQVITKLTNAGVKANYITSDWDEPFILVTSCGLMDKNSIADFIRRHGFNCHITSNETV